MTEQPPDATILVVDDAADWREVLRELLEAEGYRVAAAGDGLMAIELLNAGTRPCALLMDLMMPAMDGWDLHAHLRSRPEWAGIPVIIISAFWPTRREAPPDTVVLQKPVPAEEILRVVRETCGRSRPAA